MGQAFPTPVTIFIDDATGNANGVPLPANAITALTNAGLPLVTPARVQPSGNNTTPGTLVPNATQQQYFADATTKAVLPTFKANGSPFVLVYWSRDPDGTQHNQGDSLNTLVPGINGPTSKAGVHNADNDLKQILDFINSDPNLAANTDSGLQQGQGMHGSLGRDNTFNNMAAIGPDFKSHFVDISPVGNADIVPTLAEILGFQLSSNGELKGRVIVEALKGGPFAVFFEKQASSLQEQRRDRARPWSSNEWAQDSISTRPAS